MSQEIMGLMRHSLPVPCDNGLSRRKNSAKANSAPVEPLQPRIPTRFMHSEGPVAQWLEPAAHNRLVGSSSLSGPTTYLVSPPAASRSGSEYPVARFRNFDRKNRNSDNSNCSSNPLRSRPKVPSKWLPLSARTTHACTHC